MALPALGAAWLFGVLRAGTRRPWFAAAWSPAASRSGRRCRSTASTLFWLGRHAADDGTWSPRPSRPWPSPSTLRPRRGRPAGCGAACWNGDSATPGVPGRVARPAWRRCWRRWPSTRPCCSGRRGRLAQHRPPGVHRPHADHRRGRSRSSASPWGSWPASSRRCSAAVGRDWTGRRPAPRAAARTAPRRMLADRVTRPRPKPPAPAASPCPPRPALVRRSRRAVDGHSGPRPSPRRRLPVRPDGQVQVEELVRTAARRRPGPRCRCSVPNGDVLTEGAWTSKGSSCSPRRKRKTSGWWFRRAPGIGRSSWSRRRRCRRTVGRAREPAAPPRQSPATAQPRR